MMWKVKGTMTGTLSLVYMAWWLSDSSYIGEEMAESLVLLWEGQEIAVDSGDCFRFLWG